MSDLEKIVAQFVSNLPEKFIKQAYEKCKERYEKHKDSRKESVRKFRKTKRSKEYDRYKYGLMKKASQHLTLEEKKIVKEFYKNKPPGCQVDHIVPISRGGKHEIENLQYLPVKDNYSKGNKLFNETGSRRLMRGKDLKGIST